jgi:hypothetical protein
MSNTITKDHLGKRILVKSVDLTHPDILEARVLELSSNGTLAKLLIRNGTTWTKLDSFEVVDVMPDKSMIEEQSAALLLAKQENTALMAEKENVDKSIRTLNQSMDQAAKNVGLLTQAVENLNKENGELKEKAVADSKTIFTLKEHALQLEGQVKTLQQKLVAPRA